MFAKVLVGVDGRTNGHDAIALARRLIDFDGCLTLVNVHHPMRADQSASAHRLLEQERERAELATAELVSVAAASPGQGLHEQAEEQAADLLVVGSSSRGVLGRAMLGDDTRGALNGAPCSVAVAPIGYAAKPKALAAIGVAFNGSPESTTALDAARELAARTGAALSALEVVSIPSLALTSLPAVGDSIDEMLAEASARMQALPDIDGRAVYGIAGEELALFSEGLDLLVVGSRGYGPVRRLVLGSTSDYLERHARCALLVLPRVAAS